MVERKIVVDGFNVTVNDFGYAKYFYPSFNGDAEFKVSKKGFKELRHYLRTVKWLELLMPVEYTF